MTDSFLVRFERALRSFLEAAVALLLAAIAGICFLEVVLRYRFETSLGWYDEFVGYLLVWLTFLGAVLAQLQLQHIGIENLLESVPSRLGLWLRLLGHAVVVAVQLVLLIHGADLVTELLADQDRAISLPVPMGAIYLILPLSAAMMLIVETIHVLRLFGKTTS